MATDAVRFLVEFARRPKEIGAIAPSSRSLAERIVVPVPKGGNPLVVELGPGTGVFTDAIRRRLGGRGHQVAVEINQTLAAQLAACQQGVEVVNGDACTVDRLVADRGYDHANVVISGLPWSLFPHAAQTGILDAVTKSLAPDGSFSTFAYLHALWMPHARRFKANLDERFEEVVMTRAVWANLPPALVYHCRRPVRSGV